MLSSNAFKFLFAVLGALPLTSNAADWKLIGITDGSVVGLDPSSIQQESAWIFTVWTKTILSEEAFARHVAKKGFNDVPDYSHSLSLIRVNCRNRSYGTARQMIYNIHGEVIKELPGPTKMEAVAPDTIAESIVKVMCEITE